MKAIRSTSSPGANRREPRGAASTGTADYTGDDGQSAVDDDGHGHHAAGVIERPARPPKLRRDGIFRRRDHQYGTFSGWDIYHQCGQAPTSLPVDLASR